MIFAIHSRIALEMPRDKCGANEGRRFDAAFVRGVQCSWESNWSVLWADHPLGTNGCCHGGARGEVSCWYVAGVALRRGRVSAAGLMQGVGGKRGVDIVRYHWRMHRDGADSGEGLRYW